jgi:hypothetical protein
MQGLEGVVVLRRLGHSLASSRRTCTGCHCLFPRGVGIPASLSAAAMPCRLVTPLACSASMVGRKPAARCRTGSRISGGTDAARRQRLVTSAPMVPTARMTLP